MKTEDTILLSTKISLPKFWLPLKGGSDLVINRTFDKMMSQFWFCNKYFSLPFIHVYNVYVCLNSNIAYSIHLVTSFILFAFSSNVEIILEYSLHAVKTDLM